MKDTIKGALYGVATGDALGAPVEFMTAEEIQRKHGTVRTMLGGGWLGLKPGEITDDTAMTIAVAKGILANPQTPVPAIGTNFIEWALSNPPDIGTTCRMSIMGAIAYAKPYAIPTPQEWYNASQKTDIVTGGKSAGNGSLMRTVYVGLYYSGDKTIVEHAENISRMTHFDPTAGKACAAYSIAISDLIRGATPCAALFRGLYCAQCTDYNLDVLESPDFQPVPSGYVVDSFAAAIHCLLTTNSFENALVKAVNLGGDADTIGAIIGGLAGAAYGFKAIPKAWVKPLPPATKFVLDVLTEHAHNQPGLTRPHNP